MTEPIKLPPDLLTVTLLREGVNKHRARDIEQWMNEKMALAVEQATAELRAEVERLRADAERYRHLCEYQRWAPEIEAAFDCSPKVLIDEAIDNSIKAMKEPK